MADYPKFPDALDAWLTYLNGQLPAEEIGPNVLAGPRFVTLTRTGGPADRFTDNPMLTAGCYGGDLQEAFSLAADVRHAIHNARGRALTPTVLCKGINEFSGPADDPDEEHDSRRVSWTFAAKLRPVETPN